MTGLIGLISSNEAVRFVDRSDGQEYSLSQLTSKAELQEIGFKGLSFIYCDNSIDNLTALFRLWDSRHAIALFSSRTAADFKYTLEQLYKPAIIWDPGRDHVDGYKKSGTFFYAEKMDSFPVHPELKLLLTTSGSTGSAKLVKLSESNVVSNALSIAEYLPISTADVVPLNLPVNYSFGFSVLTTNAIRGGRIIASTGEIMQKEFWDGFSRFGYTSLAGVPYIYEMLSRLGFTRRDYPSLKYMIQAGGRLSDELRQQFAQYCAGKGIRFYIMYGQTEATARISYLPADRIADKAGSVGIPVSGGKVHISAETGELIYSGPNVFAGYAENLKDLESFIPRPELSTGDLARIDDDGYIYITGRLKRMLKVAGNRVNLDELEQLLRQSLNLKQVVIHGVDDKVLLVCLPDEIRKQEITKWLQGQAGIHPTFVKFLMTAEVPKTLNGKTDYARIVELAGF